MKQSSEFLDDRSGTASGGEMIKLKDKNRKHDFLSSYSLIIVFIKFNVIQDGNQEESKMSVDQRIMCKRKKGKDFFCICQIFIIFRLLFSLFLQTLKSVRLLFYYY